MLSDILKLLKNDIDIFRWLIFQILNDLMLTLMNNWRNRLIFFESDWFLICNCNWRNRIRWFLQQFDFSFDDCRKKRIIFVFRSVDLIHHSFVKMILLNRFMHDDLTNFFCAWMIQSKFLKITYISDQFSLIFLKQFSH